MWAPKDLLMQGVQFPSGQGDPGDDAEAASVLEAALHILRGCVEPVGRGGVAQKFSESPTKSYTYVNG